ncbi:MAG TPA: CAP domain-containing protein [Polyangiaceae bacterium]|nr:CAP domain-containing protein [Polyangiaceae bacterium]
MRIANLSVLVFAFACSSSPDDGPGGAGGAAGSMPSAGGAAGSSSGGSAQPNAGSPTSGGSSTNGGSAAAGAATGGKPSGGAAGNANAGATNGGAAAGASGGPSAGSGGGGSCVKNLACKLSPPPSTGDLYQDCVDRINQFLTQCACLPALKRRPDGEACADQMAKYDAEQNSAHAGAIAKICTPGGSQNECPGYSSNNQVIGLCMQQMWDEGPPPTADCTGECYETHGHFINMTDTSVKQVACGFHTTASGKVWAVQNFSR